MLRSAVVTLLVMATGPLAASAQDLVLTNATILDDVTNNRPRITWDR